MSSMKIFQRPRGCNKNKKFVQMDQGYQSHQLPSDLDSYRRRYCSFFKWRRIKSSSQLQLYFMSKICFIHWNQVFFKYILDRQNLKYWEHKKILVFPIDNHWVLKKSSQSCSINLLPTKEGRLLDLDESMVLMNRKNVDIEYAFTYIKRPENMLKISATICCLITTSSYEVKLHP